MFKIFLIHGFRGSPEIPPWYKWLKNELEKEGFRVLLPQFPSPQNPKVDEWLSTIEQELNGNFENVIFVGHSLGGLAALRAVQAHASHEMVKALILVGTPAQDVGRPQIKEFLPPLDWKKIKHRVQNFILFYSKDDTHVPFSHGLEFSRLLGGKFIALDHMGHFEVPDSFPKILDVIRFMF